jgi:hypothetical protein
MIKHSYDERIICTFEHHSKNSKSSYYACLLCARCVCIIIFVCAYLHQKHQKQHTSIIIRLASCTSCFCVFICVCVFACYQPKHQCYQRDKQRWSMRACNLLHAISLQQVDQHATCCMHAKSDSKQLVACYQHATCSHI